MVSELGDYVINRFEAGQAAGYPTLCKGRFKIDEDDAYAFEDPVSLDVLGHIDALREAGVVALKIEGRQRGKAYVAQVVSTMKKALTATAEDRPKLLEVLVGLSEGQKTTSGALDKKWR